MARKRTVLTVLLLSAPPATLATAASIRSVRADAPAATAATDENAATAATAGLAVTAAADGNAATAATAGLAVTASTDENAATDGNAGLAGLAAGATTAAPVGSPPGPPSDEAAPPGLLALRGALYQAGREGGRAQMSRFRPLCDRDGYPLVGNVMTKSVVYHPSEFCADVRKAAR